MQNLRMIQQSKYKNLYVAGCAEEDFVEKSGMVSSYLHNSFVNPQLMYLFSFCRTSFDETFKETGKVTSVEAFKIGKRLIQTFDPSKDRERLEIYCR